MGFTPGTDDVRGRLAFVLINRVNKIAEGYAASPSIVLGAPSPMNWAPAHFQGAHSGGTHAAVL